MNAKQIIKNKGERRGRGRKGYPACLSKSAMESQYLTTVLSSGGWGGERQLAHSKCTEQVSSPNYVWVECLGCPETCMYIW